MENKEAILKLRSRIPIGLMAAQRLLEEYGFEVLKAEARWKRDQAKQLSGELNVSFQEADELLNFVKYDYSKAASIYKIEIPRMYKRYLSPQK